MHTRATLLLAVTFAAFLAAPGTGQFTRMGDQGVFRLPGHYLALDEEPPVLFAGSNATFDAVLYDSGGRMPQNATIDLAFAQSGTPTTVAMTHTPDGHYGAIYAFPTRGHWGITITLRDGNTTAQANATLLVFPVLPLMVEVTSNTTAVAGEPQLITVAARHVAGQPTPPDVRDLTARFDHLAEPGGPTDASETLVLNESLSPNQFVLDHAFSKAGTTRAWFSSPSGGFSFDDVPPTDFTVTAAGPPPTTAVHPAPQNTTLPTAEANVTLAPSSSPAHSAPGVAFGVTGAVLAWATSRRRP
ncbi:MAG: hypothetical protein ACYDBQ_10180 [Thermoplasmatota archaeon]